jgi:CRP/FNR family transcriptional regulator, cyclic AMP receptor protein
LLTFPAEHVFIELDAWDHDVYLVLSGSTGVVILGYQYATRSAGTHIGEMATIDPTKPRSAMVKTLEPTVLAKLTEPQLAQLANDHPVIWRRFAIELANRLRQRRESMRVPNDQPIVFIGSAAERLKIARAIKNGLDHDPLIAQVWTDGVFRASEFTITNLAQAAEKSDFGVIVVGPHDVVERRDARVPVTRDNVIFELGLFIGAVGQHRTFIVKPRGVELALATDMLGITPLEYVEGPDETLPARIASVCNDLRSLISDKGVR